MNHGPWERLQANVRMPSPVELLSDDRLRHQDVQLFLKRDDLIHPEVPGNKWRKLKYNIAEATSEAKQNLLTFGGAYSNHIRATAAVGYYCGFSTIGIIRGEEHLPLNPSLAYAVERGMKLSYMDRATYRRKSEADVVSSLREKFGSFYLLPEGGSNELAVRGCAELPPEISIDFDIICCPCGTGGTLAGIAAGLKRGQRAIGFSALKGAASLNDEVAELQRDTYGHSFGNWTIEHSFHFGGFAKRTSELDAFISDFHAHHGITLEWVYVAKMMYGIYSLINEGRFQPGTRIVAVLTGPGGIG